MKLFLITLCLIGLMRPVLATSGGQVNTGTLASEVTAAAIKNLAGNFLNWKLTGMCIWEHWTLFGPYFTQTWEINEFLPDAVVTVYNRSGEDPLFYGYKLLDPKLKKLGDKIAQSTLGMKPIAGNDSAASHNDGMLQFKEVDIIGDPVVNLVSHMIPSMMIPSAASPYTPYYSSLLDSIEWREPNIDLLTHPQDLLINIGGVSDWGSLYPRNGYVDQGGDYKAAAVDAIRATDIAAIAGGVHIYNSLKTTSCGQHCTIEPSSEFHADDFLQIKFQEIYPVESNTAKKNIGVDDPITGTYGQDQYNKGNGNYLWVMWRHYYGCIQGGGSLFHVISF